MAANDANYGTLLDNGTMTDDNCTWLTWLWRP